ncbi:MAG: M48 family metallopeptidase [bacterium]|nr:M48 family metallopeptidase [bacterium]
MQKTIEAEGIGEIIFARRKGTKSLRLSINGGKIRLSAPYGVSEAQALRFLMQKKDWILKHVKEEPLLKSGDKIGRAHKLFFEPYEVIKPSSRISQQTILVRYPRSSKSYNEDVQQAAHRGAKKAIAKEASNLLIKRLQDISMAIQTDYKSVETKFMKSRWGHCSNRNEITLNTYLVQLDWKLIDYVIIHELAHTLQHNHSDKFWAIVAKFCPEYKQIRRELKSKQTDIIPNSINY